MRERREKSVKGRYELEDRGVDLSTNSKILKKYENVGGGGFIRRLNGVVWR
jgi:hypothetical protein